MTQGVLINQLCGHVSLLGEGTETRHEKVVCARVCVRACVRVLPSPPDVSHIERSSCPAEHTGIHEVVQTIPAYTPLSLSSHKYSSFIRLLNLAAR